MYKKGEVGFRPIEESDLEDLRMLRNDPSTYLNLGKVGMETVQSQYKWWASGLISDGDQRYALFEISTNKILGQLRINNIDNENSHCEIGIDISLKYRGLGYGKKCYLCILDYLFRQKNFKTIYLRVGDFNTNAIKLYEKLGFINTGFYKNYLFRNGGYHNYLIFSISNENYKC
jgi:RimJ/RimL family protein N-acetyltransferase